MHLDGNQGIQPRFLRENRQAGRTGAGFEHDARTAPGSCAKGNSGALGQAEEGGEVSGEILSGSEVLTLLETFVCECGYKLTDSDLAFSKSGDITIYECPGCGDRWTLTPAQKQ